jgi:flagellar biosynthesis/type III secretory pathway chaperone
MSAGHLDRARALLGLLEQEYLVLKSGDGAALKAICFDKIGHLRQLEGLLVSLKTPNAGMDTSERRTLAELLGQCLQRNQLNETLLHSRMHRVRQAMQLRRGAPAQYDARGGGNYEVQRTLRSVA